MVIKLKLFTLLGLFLVLSSCSDTGSGDRLSSDLIQNPVSAEGNQGQDNLPKFQFVTTEHDFGKIIDGVKVAYKFKFTNVGGADLIIAQVQTTCGCTVSRFPKEAIKPGKSAFIELTFDSSNRHGFNHKSASVVANTQPNVFTLNIKAMVMNANEL